MRKMLLLSFALAALFSGSVLAQSFSSLEERMTEAEFKAAGLDKLSPEELAALNAFIAAETGKVASTLPAATPAVDNRGFNKPTGPDGAIYSSISGEFRGWSNGTVFALANGESWRVTEGSYSARPVSNPGVTIRPGMISGWYMEVDGHPVKAKVRRLK